MVAAGYEVVGADPDRNYSGALPWHGSIKEVEKRIADREERRAAAQARLDEALLDVDARAQRDAESKARRDALNALYIKASSDGSRLVAYRSKQAFIDDEPYEPADMTPLEREAFERMDQAHRRPVTT